MVTKVNSGYKIKEAVDLAILVNFGFDPSPEFNEYYRYRREDEYLWVDKHTRIIDMTSPQYLCPFARCKRIISKLKKAGLVEQTKESVK